MSRLIVTRLIVNERGMEFQHLTVALRKPWVLMPTARRNQPF
jgi:hypothetical protein